MINSVASFVVGLLLIGSLQAETIYRYLDDRGGVTYTNIPSGLPRKGVEKIHVPIPPPADIRLPPAPVMKVKPNPPVNFPKVDSQTQRKRDLSRKQILDDELKAEQQSLDAAKKALSEAEAVKIGADKNHQKYIERMQGFKEQVSRHEKNVDALKKEISGLR
ncbi:MAG: DUF4124 domain-containing protein [Burkholderiales bacterium]